MFSSRPIRVYLVDDHEIVRHGLRGFLDTAEDIQVVGDSGDGRRALSDLEVAQYRGEAVDVVLLDLVMPTIGGFDLAQRIGELENAPKIVIVSAYGNMDRVQQALDLRVAGYVTKSSRPDNILDAVRSGHRGDMYIDPEIGMRLAKAATERRHDSVQLTRREREVASLVAKGKSNIDIANELFISERTARTHVSHLLGKLELQSRVQLALWAVDAGNAKEIEEA
ncbi:MAG: response regulator transcription factor [Actinomycetota bacterium]|nr:response regulator transcription factor [Actinomycetota bacterium]